jgi:hypothetical protein
MCRFEWRKRFASGSQRFSIARSRMTSRTGLHERFALQILIEPAAWRYQSEGWAFEQLDDGIGSIFVQKTRFVARQN